MVVICNLCGFRLTTNQKFIISKDFYEKMPKKDKSFLLMQPVYFLAEQELTDRAVLKGY